MLRPRQKSSGLLQRFFDWFNRVFARVTDRYVSIAGALIGGYLLGALEVFIVAFLPSEISPYRDAIVFILLIGFTMIAVAAHSAAITDACASSTG